MTIAFLLSLLLSAFLFILVLDQGATVSYMEHTHRDTRADLRRVTRLLPGRIARKDLVFLLRQYEPKAFIVDNSEGVSIGGLEFEFDAKGRLLKVRHWTGD